MQNVSSTVHLKKGIEFRCEPLYSKKRLTLDPQRVAVRRTRDESRKKQARHTRNIGIMAHIDAGKGERSK